MRASERGLTLIELLVTIAVASVVILAATQVVMVVTQAKRTNERRLEVFEAAGTALSLIEFDAQNAGYRFASPVFSVRVINDVQGNEPELAPVTGVSGCGNTGWGIARGSDTIEFRYGVEDLVPGADSPMTCSGGTCTVTLGGGGARNPFHEPGPDGANALVLLVNGNASCLGRVGPAGVNSSTMTMQLLGLDLTNVTDVASSFPGCETGDFTVMRAARRVRYMVCQPPAGSTTERPGLYRQVAIEPGGFGVPEVVQEGIEDLQIALRFDNQDGALSALLGCTNRMCTCNRSAGDCGALNLNPAKVDNSTGAQPEEKLLFRLRGIDVAVTAVSTRNLGQNVAFEQFVRPALFDRPAGTTKTADLRRTRETSVSLVNLVMVNP
jgi:prepilin-type N-terminal cleavage/methylation domain-containing protein